MSRYVINVLASKDLNEIADYFQSQNIQAGEKFFREFNRKCKQLIAFPNSGRKYDEIYPDLRGLTLSGYIIFYRLLDDDIEILRVIHGRRNIETIFTDDY